MAGVADRADRGRDRGEQPLAVGERQPAQVAPGQGQQVEREQRPGPLQRGARGGGGVRADARLEPLRRGPPLVVEHDQLPVEHRISRQEPHGERHLGEARGEVLARRRAQHRPHALAARRHAPAALRHLEEPAGAVERRAARPRQHRRDPSPRERARRGAQARGLARGRLGPARPGRELLHRAAGEHRGLGERPPRPGERIAAVLQEQPLALPALRGAGPDQRPLTVELVAAQPEDELAAGQPVLGVADRPPRAAIPHDDGPGAVVPRGNDPLEVGVLDRVILDLDGHAAVGRVGGRALRHGPAPQRAAQLQPEVPVEPPRRVLLDHEGPRRAGIARAGLTAAERLRRPARVAHGAVSLQPVGHRR
ncbi:hypothetical protein PSR1_04232 [Anaeromyxobacter sp. PSR-1]|nr:hypothetical protein PSR1_04232 [Anaeromyxobacter sp. PSR-1]